MLQFSFPLGLASCQSKLESPTSCEAQNPNPDHFFPPSMTRLFLFFLFRRHPFYCIRPCTRIPSDTLDHVADRIRVTNKSDPETQFTCPNTRPCLYLHTTSFRLIPSNEQTEKCVCATNSSAESACPNKAMERQHLHANAFWLTLDIPRSGLPTYLLAYLPTH